MRALLISTAAGVGALLTISGQAQAQASRTFVSGHGSDTNPCSLTAPCRSFAQALSQTNAGGEVAVLDTAGYGTVTITKAVSIVNQEGVEAGVTVTSGDAITVNTGSSDVVNLRGLTLTGGGVGQNGIVFKSLGTLNIQNCVIRSFTGDGLALKPTGTAAFQVTDTIVSDNSLNGVEISPTGSGAVTAVFNRVQAIDASFEGFLINSTGTTDFGSLNVTIANGLVSHTGTGIFTEGMSGAAITNVMVSNTVVSNNGTGVGDTGENTQTLLAKNTISGNGVAFNIGAAGAVASFGDNDIGGNSNNGGAIPLIATK